MGCPAKKTKKCHKKTIIVCPRKKKKRSVIVKKKIVKVKCPPLNPILTLSPSRRVCTRFPSSSFNFFNGELLLIPGGNAVPYPSPITVSGLTGPLTKVTATLVELTHTNPDDLDILLVGPDGTNTMLMSDAGGVNAIVNVTLTFDDNAANFLPDETQIVSGTFKPSNFDTPPENLPAPAPPTSLSVALSNLTGMDPNGTWNLFVFDDNPPIGLGNMRSWALSITTPEKEECIFTPL
ncbi:proprotein convertase P-domain-containing protein [Paenibacillus sp. MBLB4367]|uniref:proprotein convertase P-domain-containing protein n=1 Tax=Paenibacillus sp. MBLB4367 TaxID=3384767 RepID=UPI0039081729